MAFRSYILIILVLVLSIPVYGARGDDDEITLKNAGISRTVSGISDLLRTSKIAANDTQILAGPSVEFMLDIDYKGKPITLIPSDFMFKDIDSVTKGREKRISIEMLSKDESLPLVVYMNYYFEPKTLYMSKSISVDRCKAMADGVLKRVTIEMLQLSDSYQPVSDYGAIDQKAGKGVFFSIDTPGGKVNYGANRFLTVTEDVNASLGKNFESGRFIIGASMGDSNSLFASYRQFLLETRYASLNKNPKFAEFKKRFEAYFRTYQQVSLSVDCEAHISDGKGFILLFNTSAESKKVILPLSDSTLGLTGELKLSDWSEFSTPVDMGAKKPGESAEVEIAPGAIKIIGINIDL